MVCLHGRRDNSRALASGLSTIQAERTCSTIPRVTLARFGVSRAKDFRYLGKVLQAFFTI